MISTLYDADALGSPAAFVAALLLGFGFGFALERAGFSSSRRLAGVFYFSDMAVVKVMFSALLTALLGLSYLMALGWIRPDQVFLIPTIYGAQIVGGLIFGVGFVMGAWCPGTAAAGLAAGRVDALVFLAGCVGGSILFNELFPLLRGLYAAGDRGVLTAYDALGMPRNVFILLFTVIAVAAFWLCEWAEKARTGRAPYLGTPFLKAFSLALVAAAAGLWLLTAAAGVQPADPTAPTASEGERELLQAVEQAQDHVEPEELADRLMAGEPGLVVVDVRPEPEFRAFHIRGAIRIPLTALADDLRPHRNAGTIVLYSNGMTHPAQARDSLQRQGFTNVYLLTDGLQGFRDRCLKPVSLRAEPLAASATERVNAWRAYFSSGAEPAAPAPGPAGGETAARLPRIVETEQLAARLGGPNFRILDLRPQPEYNTSHIPGSLSLNVESLRGNIGGVPSMLLPPALLAAQFSLLGLRPDTAVALVSGEKFHDATLAAMAFERMGHRDYAILNGGFAKWAQEGRPVDAALPVVTASVYPVPEPSDDFTVDSAAVARAAGRPGFAVVDVRPADFFSGRKSDEARAGHIPGAINRPYTQDVDTATNKVVVLKPAQDLAAAYGGLLPSKDAQVIVHCRTGHQASQTFFILKHVLGYPHVRWYDGGWTEWAARPDLPVATGP